MIEIEYENLAKNFRGKPDIFMPYAKKAEKILRRLPQFENMDFNGKVMLTMVNDKEIRALNREYRGVDKPTDVLSFSYFGEENFPVQDTLGEILISIPAAVKQAKDHGKTLNEELQFLFLHGLLHVFGFDHIKKGNRREMFDLQDKIIGDKSWRAIADAEADGVPGLSS